MGDMEKRLDLQHDVTTDFVEKETLRTTIWDRGLLLFSTILFVIMLILVLLQVFTRYVTAYVGISFPWTEEFASYLLTITTFLGGPLPLPEGARCHHHPGSAIPWRRGGCWRPSAISWFLFSILCMQRVMMMRTWRSPLEP